MDRPQLLARLDRHWRGFTAAIAGLSEAAMLEPRTLDDWSVKDLVAHIAVWERESLKALPLVLQGKRPPRYGGIDRFNAEQIVASRQRSLAALLDDLAATHAKLIAYVATVPAAAFATETRFRHRLRIDTYAHYPLHTEPILRWREARSI